MSEFWKTKLTAFDAQLCKMIESLTKRPCEPKNGGNHYFLEVDYRENADPQYILAIWDAIEGRAGKRLISLKDDPDRQCLWARVKFYEPDSADKREAAFIPKIETE